jgi:symplekin
MADTTGSLTSVAKTLEQLRGARKLVLGDATLYPQIIHGILPLIGPDALLELQRWGAEFLAEAFANPRLPKYDKQQLCTLVLGTIKGMLDIKGEDPGVLKSAILASASLYPLVFSQMYVSLFLLRK